MIPFGGFMQSTGGLVPGMGLKGSPAPFASVEGVQTGDGENGFPACVADLLGLEASGNGETPEPVEMDGDPLVDAGGGAAKWPMADLSETAVPSEEMPVDPVSPPSDTDPLPLSEDMAVAAAMPSPDEGMPSVGAQAAQGATDEAGGSRLQPAADQRPTATAPGTPSLPLQSQPMRTGGQASGPGQGLSPPSSNTDPMAPRSSDAMPMTSNSPSEVKAPPPSIDRQPSAGMDEPVQPADKNAMERANQHRERAAGEIPANPKIAGPGHPHSGPAANLDQAGNPIGSESNPASQQNPSGRFQARDTDPSPQRMETAESEKHPSSTTVTAESPKPHTPESIKAPPVIHEATRTPLSQTPAANPVRMGEAAEKSFQSTVMDQIVDRAALRSVQGRSEVQIRLKPEFLGNVQMHISTDKDQVVVRIMTDQPVVKEIIETHLHQLKAELGNQGMTIDRFDIAVNPDADNPNQRDQFANMFKNNTSRDGQARSDDPEQESEMHEEKSQADDGRPGHEGVNYFA